MPTIALLLAALLAADPAPPSPDEQELTTLGRCAISMSVYENVIDKSQWSGVTAADRSRLTAIKGVEDVLETRANAIADRLGEERAKQVADNLLAEFNAGLEGDDKTLDAFYRRSLDIHGPMLDACVRKASSQA